MEGTGKLKSNKPVGPGPDCRPHGTRHKTGVAGVMNPDMVRKLAAQGMGLAEIGYFYGCGKSNIHHAIRSDEAIQQAWNEGLAQAIEKATSCLMKNITEHNNVLAAMFFLKCKHLTGEGERGWVEEQHKKEQPDNNLPRVSIYIPHNNRDAIPEDAIIEDSF